MNLIGGNKWSLIGRRFLISLLVLAGWLCAGTVFAVDTDGDGLPDNYEDSNTNNIVDSGETDPLDPDTDGDGYGDGMELTQGSDPLDIGNIPEHRDPNRVICFADRAQDKATLSGAPLMNLNLRRRLQYWDSQSDRLVVSEHNTVQIFRDPNDLGSRDHFDAPTTVTGTSGVVRGDDGKDTVYTVSTYGEVERWDIDGVKNVWSADSRRCSADRLEVPPMIQLRRFSSAAFQAKYSTDLVYVGTRFSSLCPGDSDEDNQIIAYNGATGAVEWIFNERIMGVAPYDMDVIRGGIAHAQGSDILFVGSGQTASQDSLWAIDVLTGTLLWSVNVGVIWSKPQLMDNRLYVSTSLGRIKAINPSTGATLWTTSNGGTPISSDFSVIETNAGEILISSVDTAGKVWVVRDDNFFGSDVWSVNLPGTTASGPLIVGPGGENLFIGGADGRIYQLDLATGTVEASRLAAAGEAITDLAIQERHSSGRVPSLFATTASGHLLRFCLPFRTNTYPLDTDGDGVTDGVDNAPNVANPGQADSDQDGIGDVIDPPDLEQGLVGYLLWNGGDTNNPDVQFDADLNSNDIPNGIEFFQGDAFRPIPSCVTVNTNPYSEFAFRRSWLAFGAGYQLNYSFDLVDWYVAQAGIDGVIITVLNDVSDTITIRIPANGSNTFFCTLEVSIASP